MSKASKTAVILTIRNEPDAPAEVFLFKTQAKANRWVDEMMSHTPGGYDYHVAPMSKPNAVLRYIRTFGSSPSVSPAMKEVGKRALDLEGLIATVTDRDEAADIETLLDEMLNRHVARLVCRAHEEATR